MEQKDNLYGYWRLILKEKRIVLLIVGVITGTSILVSLILPRTYVAEASLMPLGGQGGGGMAMAAAGQFGLGGLLASLGGSSSSSTQLLAILKSRTLAERVIEKQGLMKVFYSKLWDRKNERWKVDDPRKAPPMEGAVKNLFSKVSFRDEKKNQLIGRLQDLLAQLLPVQL